MRSGLQHVITEMVLRRGPADGQYFAGGVWHSPDARCWPCNVGPGTAAAVLWRTGTWRRRSQLRIAEQTFDRAILDHSQPDGSFGPPGAGEPSNVIATLFFANELGMAYHELEPALDGARSRRWQAALARAAAYLAPNLLSHYVNGNINLGAALMFRLTALATRDPHWAQLFNQELAFTLSPPAAVPGIGLQFAVRPTTPDYADGRGYLGEQGSRGAGYDPEYTQLQDDVAARLFAVAHNQLSLRLLNLLTNQLLQRVDGEQRLHTDGGSRHGKPGSVVPFTTSALPTLAFAGNRPDLRTAALRQTSRIVLELDNAIRFPYDNSNRLVGLVATTLVNLTPALAP